MEQGASKRARTSNVLYAYPPDTDRSAALVPKSEELCTFMVPSLTIDPIVHVIQAHGTGAALQLVPPQTDVDAFFLRPGDVYFDHMTRCPKRHAPWARMGFNFWSGQVPTQFPFADYIQGPVKFAHLVYNVGDVRKEVYLFGERHDRTFENTTPDTECAGFVPGTSTSMHVAIFLSEWLRRSEVFVDLFIEHPLFSSAKLQDCFLQDLDKKMLPCLLPDKSGCVYEAARVHSIDWNFLRSHEHLTELLPPALYGRFSEKVELAIILGDDVLLKKTTRAFRSKFNRFQESWRTPALQRWIDWITLGHVEAFSLGPDYETTLAEELAAKLTLALQGDEVPAGWADYVGNLIRGKEEWARLRKNLSAIKPAFKRVVPALIREWSRRTSKHIISLFQRVEHNLASFQAEPIASFLGSNLAEVAVQEIVDAAYGVYTIFYNVCMDLYTIARMFKDYGSSRYGPADANNLIVYAGYAHTDVYVKALRAVGFKATMRIRTSDLNACIPMADIRGELFFPLTRRVTHVPGGASSAVIE
jgi:hypothetical protein